MTATAITQLIATTCAVCGRPLTDPLSAALAIGPDCRAMYGYDVEQLPFAVRDELHRIVHTIASFQQYRTADGQPFEGALLRAAIFRIAELGLPVLARRVERRLERRIVHAEIESGVERQLDLVLEPTTQEQQPKLDLPFKLTEGQEAARALVSRVKNSQGFACGFVVGFAGTGKTTILRVFAAEHGSPIIITPTGKAALRVREATGLEASTIHRWLYKAEEDEKTGVVKFVRRKNDDLTVPKSRLILLDEASMVGPDVWKDVYMVCKQHELKLVLIGDGFQLPPVQPPNAPPFSVLTKEFAEAFGAERVEMTEVVRQAHDSPVIRASMALRSGEGIRSLLTHLQRIDTHELRDTVTRVHSAGGATVCHRNVTRFALNAGIRQALGIYDEMPQKGEPILVLKNTYEAGLVNGETFPFEGWTSAHEGGHVLAPEVPEQIYDRYKDVKETARFGATTISRARAVLALEQLHGRLSVGDRAVQDASSRWARLESVMSGDNIAPHIHANFGYCYTAHKAQGSEFPYVLVVLEPSVRLDEEEGRRWAYTAVTRAKQAAAIHLGTVSRM